MWVHINKFGINEVFDAEQVRRVGFAVKYRDTPNGVAVATILAVEYRDGSIFELTSPELDKNKDKCHQLIREFASALSAVSPKEK
jgi:hypothetical protein